MQSLDPLQLFFLNKIQALGRNAPKSLPGAGGRGQRLSRNGRAQPLTRGSFPLERAVTPRGARGAPPAPSQPVPVPLSPVRGQGAAGHRTLVLRGSRESSPGALQNENPPPARRWAPPGRTRVGRGGKK